MSAASKALWECGERQALREVPWGVKRQAGRIWHWQSTCSVTDMLYTQHTGWIIELPQRQSLFLCLFFFFKVRKPKLRMVYSPRSYIKDTAILPCVSAYRLTEDTAQHRMKLQMYLSFSGLHLSNKVQRSWVSDSPWSFPNTLKHIAITIKRIARLNVAQNLFMDHNRHYWDTSVPLKDE